VAPSSRIQTRAITEGDQPGRRQEESEMASFIDKAKDKIQQVEEQVAGHAKKAEAKVGELKDKVEDALGNVKHDVKEEVEKVKENLKKTQE
jgi:gas vesicle protein